MEENNLTQSDFYANWLMDLADTLKDFAGRIEGEADTYFNIESDDLNFAIDILGEPEPIQNDQDLAAKKAAYLERLLADLADHLKNI